MNTPTQFTNPLEDPLTINKAAAPCVMVIFGATGDLTGRKLFPALYNLAREGQLPAHFACVGFARRPKTNETFRQEMFDAVNKYSRVKPVEPNLWNSFSEQIFYHQSEFHEDEGYERLDKFLKELDSKFDTQGNRVFYLSTQPSFFPLIIQKLHDHKLIYPVDDSRGRWSRVIIEKPFGHDLDSAISLHKEVSKCLDESQVYRIDHYLGKETVQNLLIFRFCNPIFESVWNNRYIDHIQITVGEEIGIGTRGHFWEEAGMLRDIVQNHMMQLLSLVAMEPPANLTADGIHDEKVKVMQSIRPLPMDSIDEHAVRGQYGPGYINGQEVVGYRQEKDVAPDSNVETFVALELHIDNWRWAGVPFYLRAGKRLPKRATEIAITFKEAPACLFQASGHCADPNILVIRIQPDEGISFKINCKVPGLNNRVQPVKMDFRYGSYFGLTPPEAYERLICDCMAGDGTLFARIDEVLASWRLLTPLLNHWLTTKQADFPNYASGTWGPAAADQLLAKKGYQWRLI
jgi:glucose-6-phosphate 1-dehydrogenase